MTCLRVKGQSHSCFKFNKVLILARTKMSADKICVGAYDLDENRYVRLLDTGAKPLSQSACYKLGEVYEIKYQNRYQNQLTPPHMEDIVVYEYELIERIPADKLFEFVNQIAIDANHISELFQSSLSWLHGYGFITKNQVPNHSVCIARLKHDLRCVTEYYNNKKSVYFELLNSDRMYKIKYVGEIKLRDNFTLHKGYPIRFSLARWWDKGDGVERCHLQLSCFYLKKYLE
ncbi:hypothetical protein ACF3N0_01615 [Moraxella atlantae]|uniref:dual OB domain-containing protein n=1 Tax=Faucicola atlantae TaxID=34059 RepID=UPI0037524602